MLQFAKGRRCLRWIFNMFKTMTLASIYELQGLKNEAELIYREIALRDPPNIQAKLALKRLSEQKEGSAGLSTNRTKSKTKVQAEVDIKDDLNKLEEWLLKWD